MSLPLKVRIGIRDLFDKTDSPVQQSRAALTKLLGYNVVIEPEWSLLAAELGEVYSDKTQLVSIICAVVRVWITSVTALLNDESNEAWTETLIEKTKPRAELRLFLEISNNVSTIWSDQQQGFIIGLPKMPIEWPAELEPLFTGLLLRSFKEEKPSIRTSAPDDTADLEADETSGTATVADDTPNQTTATTATTPAVATVPSFISVVATLPRPDELLLRPPYHLMMQAGQRTIEVECSHSPTLVFLSDYLKRWCRTNHQDTRNPPAVAVKLHQSAFALGQVFDRMTVSTEENRYNTQHVTSPLLLALIEGTLGYKFVSGQPQSWHYRRDVPFRK